jgi:hypothetical protein
VRKKGYRKNMNTKSIPVHIEEEEYERGGECIIDLSAGWGEGVEVGANFNVRNISLGFTQCSFYWNR